MQLWNRENWVMEAEDYRESWVNLLDFCNERVYENIYDHCLGSFQFRTLTSGTIPNRWAHIILNPKTERARHLPEPNTEGTQSLLSIAVNNSIREIYVNFAEHNFDTHQIMHAMRRDPTRSQRSKRNQADLATPTRPDQLAWLRNRHQHWNCDSDFSLSLSFSFDCA